jgi:hypothetical protein
MTHGGLYFKVTFSFQSPNSSLPRNARNPLRLQFIIIMGFATCTIETCELSTSPYGYRPSIAANSIFLGVASICLANCVAGTVRSRRGGAFGVVMALACVLEMFGYADRLVGRRSPWDVYPFVQSTVLLTIAPIFITSRLVQVV